MIKFSGRGWFLAGLGVAAVALPATAGAAVVMQKTALFNPAGTRGVQVSAQNRLWVDDHAPETVAIFGTPTHIGGDCFTFYGAPANRDLVIKSAVFLVSPGDDGAAATTLFRQEYHGGEGCGHSIAASRTPGPFQSVEQTYGDGITIEHGLSVSMEVQDGVGSVVLYGTLEPVN